MQQFQVATSQWKVMEVWNNNMTEFLKGKKATADQKYLHQKKKTLKEQDCESHS